MVPTLRNLTCTKLHDGSVHACAGRFGELDRNFRNAREGKQNNIYRRPSQKFILLEMYRIMGVGFVALTKGLQEVRFSDLAPITHIGTLLVHSVYNNVPNAKGALRSVSYILAGEFREGYSPTTQFACLGAPFLNVF